jgi:putative membrane protein
MSQGHDPRTYFAAERTLLAWIRTGIATLGLGFVVARFGLFLRLVAHVERPSHQVTSTVLGVGLMLAGVLAMVLAVYQHARFRRALGPEDLPKDYATGLGGAFALVLSALGLALAVYLAFWGRPV